MSSGHRVDRRTSDRLVGAWPEQTSSPNAPVSATSSNIEQLISRIWARRWVFSLVALMSVGAMVSWAYLAHPRYQGIVTLLPQQNEGAGGAMASLLGGDSLSGAGGLMGLGMLGQGNDQEGIALLNSRNLFETFMARENLLPVLFSRDWNTATHQWRNPHHVPTMDDAWGAFDRRIRQVDEDKQTGVVKFKITWTNRQMAASWANELVSLANNKLRQRALQESKASLAILQQQLDAAKSVELQSAISRAMEVEINKEVMASSRSDYAFAVLDPATVPDPDKFSSPRRALILLAVVPVAFILGMVAVLALDALGDFRRTLKRVRSMGPKRDDE